MNVRFTIFLILPAVFVATCLAYYTRSKSTSGGLEITLVNPVISGNEHSVKVPLNSIVGKAKLISFDSSCGCMGCFLNGERFTGAPMDVSADSDCSVRLNLIGKQAGRHAFTCVLNYTVGSRKYKIPVRFLVDILDGLIVSPNALDLRDNAPVEIRVETDSPLHHASVVHAEVIDARNLDVACTVERATSQKQSSNGERFQLATVWLQRRELEMEGHYRLRVTVEGNQLPAREIPFRLLGSSNRMRQSVRRLFISADNPGWVDFFPADSTEGRDMVLVSSPPGIDIKIHPKELNRTRVEFSGSVVGTEPVPTRLADSEGQNYEVMVENFPELSATHKQE